MIVPINILPLTKIYLQKKNPNSFLYLCAELFFLMRIKQATNDHDQQALLMELARIRLSYNLQTFNCLFTCNKENKQQRCKYLQETTCSIILFIVQFKLHKSLLSRIFTLIKKYKVHKNWPDSFSVPLQKYIYIRYHRKDNVLCHNYLSVFFNYLLKLQIFL